MEQTRIHRSPAVENFDDFVIDEYTYKDFLYTVNIKKETGEAKAFRFVLGGNDELSSYWLVKLDFENNQIVVMNENSEIIKSINYLLENNKEYKVNLLMNDQTLKVYVNDPNVSSLVTKLDGYEGGKVGTDFNHFTHKQEEFTNLNTLVGNLNCGGYTVSKVVNLTDGNYSLQTSQWSVSDSGILSISQAYLKTLENNTEYKFRAITSLTELDFYVKTKEIGAQVNSALAKYYRGQDAKFELSENTHVSKVLIDQEECNFTQTNQIVVVKNEDLNNVASGEHKIKFFTENGRPETTFGLYEVVEVIPEVPEAASHVFFFIDIAIFATFILGYILISKVFMRNK